MVFSYASVYTTRNDIVTGLKNLANENKNGTGTEAEIKEVLASWKKNCPNLFLNVAEGKEFELVPRVKTLIGAKRTLIIQTLLNEMRDAQK